jgi:murein DD-endopeptidase MepM/ murein hydrolase activator NlpD
MNMRRQKTGNRGAVLILAAALGILPVAAPGISPVTALAATKKDVDDAKGKISSLEEEKKKAEAAIQELEGLKSNTETYVRQLDSQVDSLGQEVSRLEGDIAGKTQSIGETTEKLKEAEVTEQEQYESMKLRIKYMYENGDSSYLNLLLESRSVSELLNRAEYVSKISEYDREMLDQYVATKEGIAADKQKLEEEKEELEDLKSQTEAKQNAVELLLNEKSQELERVNAQIGEKTAEAEAYEKDIKAQEDAIRRIEEELRRQEEEARKAAEAAGKTYNTVSLGNINFIWPCPSSSRITSAFGSRTSPTEGASSNHKGIDIGASTGSNILAAADGTVSIATYSYSAGNYIMLNHGGGVTTVYMHCSSLLVSPGETVKKGQVIAKVGSTGYSTGPHLHFGIRYNGSYVNPSSYVSP